MAKILVIDDDEDIASTTKMIVESGGHIAETELDEKRALTHIQAMKPDCLVLDVMFPGNPDAGFELSREIRSKYPKLPIIMVTSVNQFSSVKFSNRDKDETWLPIDEFIDKPVKKDKLLALITKLVPQKA